ncbi:hypothetical protein GpartN1_g5810.t1 [Galdieria partita]|uniref:Uncharacterized protein n=1 Tax=Galdieria partita TaxID=83374 RepID=A0A9C7USC7_9RHOD|nr:hypothetical protein GpartN1_g5810.t1 [Galdieria partita]
MADTYSCFYSTTSMILWGIRAFLYLVILTFSLAIVGMIGRKENNVWNTTLPWNHTFVDFCAYEASSMKLGELSVGNHHTCPYVVALSTVSSVFHLTLFGLTILESWQVFLSKYWPAEFLLNLFFFWWWLIGAVVVTSQRPSSEVLSMLSLTKFIQGIEGLAWCNFSLCFLACVATVITGYFSLLKHESSKNMSEKQEPI